MNKNAPGVITIEVGATLCTGVGVSLTTGVGVGVGVGVSLTIGVGVGVGVGVGTIIGVLGEGEASAVTVGVGVANGVGEGALNGERLHSRTYFCKTSSSLLSAVNAYLIFTVIHAST